MINRHNTNVIKYLSTTKNMFNFNVIILTITINTREKLIKTDSIVV